ncbi:MAG: PA0069 family radical SAM protein [Planctomycetota bacterium]|nr:PA0069 family radical SAM protein [Planctomycetota bacterium]
MPDDHEFPDALLVGTARGRASGLNPGNRFESVRLHVLGEHLDAMANEHEHGVQVKTSSLADRTRSLINRVDSPDLPFHWTINPYRGCEHGCIYCYARPTHELLGFSCGLDFETRILVKHDAPTLLVHELARPSWAGEPIMMSGVTDSYQPMEAKLQITRQCLAVMADCRQPVCIVTKNRLVTRDIDHLATLAGHGACKVAISVTTLDAKLSAIMEPRASRPADRLRAIHDLSEAGIPVMAMIAPVIPGLTDHEIPKLLEAVKEAGAISARWIMLRLPHQVKGLFLEWLMTHQPLRAKKVEKFIRGMRDGQLYDSDYGTRMRGKGPMADHIDAMFKVYARKYKLDRETPPLSTHAFRPPERAGQMRLFDPG